MKAIVRINRALKDKAIKVFDSKKVVDGYRSYKFFEQPPKATDFCSLFDIPYLDAAFRIVTEGQGEELRKINSLRSSSLLSLLCFGRLFAYPHENKGTDSLVIKIEGKDIKFTNSLFEVRNQVIRLPSCVDVVLQSEDEKILLFLESKFTEYVKRNSGYGVKKGYGKLYNSPAIQEMLKHNDLIWDSNQLIISLRRKGGDKAEVDLDVQTDKYFEGVKQSISHLIGLVRGPQNFKKGFYPNEYYKMYSQWFRNAEKIVYGTIMFDCSKIGAKEELDDYIQFYKSTVGKFAPQIIDDIRRLWPKPNLDIMPQITVLQEPLTYQSLFRSPQNKVLLTQKVRDFYQL